MTIKFEALSNEVISNIMLNDSIELIPPKDFNFEECLIFLGRSNNEVLHTVNDGSFYKLLKSNEELILLKVYMENGSIKIEFPAQKANRNTRILAANYIWDLFDLGRDLNEFYQIAKNDNVLKKSVNDFKGLRIIGIPDLFEAITWAIMGQQINLTFAYTLKRRFVEQFGESFQYHDEIYWVFPSPNRIASLQVSDLTNLQFTVRKAEYIIGIAKLFVEGFLSKEKFIQMEKKDVYQTFLNIRGIGSWTADYVIMKCLNDTSAFPIADVGLHNALKNQLGLSKKPTISEIENLALNWKGWEAYATFYLWRSLYN